MNLTWEKVSESIASDGIEVEVGGLGSRSRDLGSRSGEMDLIWGKVSESEVSDGIEVEVGGFWVEVKGKKNYIATAMVLGRVEVSSPHTLWEIAYAI